MPIRENETYFFSHLFRCFVVGFEGGAFSCVTHVASMCARHGIRMRSSVLRHTTHGRDVPG